MKQSLVVGCFEQMVSFLAQKMTDGFVIPAYDDVMKSIPFILVLYIEVHIAIDQDFGNVRE